MLSQVNFRRSISAISISIAISASAYAADSNLAPVNSAVTGDQQTTVVEFGPYKVNVPKGGYYDRFRMNPDLNEVAKDRGGPTCLNN